MMDILGIKRISILSVLAVVCAASALVLYGYVQPQYLENEIKLRRVGSQVSVLQSDLDAILSDFKALEGQKERFALIEKKGFFKKQGRYEVQEIFEALQKESGIIQVRVSGDGADVEESKHADDAEHALLASNIKLTIDALDDRNIYHFISLLKKKFPGHVSVDGMTISRKIELNDDILQMIARGEDPVLVQGVVDIIWRTMIAKSEILIQQEGQ